MNEFIFTWSIENISYAWHRRDAIVSPSFIADTLKNTAWTLRLYLMGNTPLGRAVLEDFLSLYLIRGEDDGPQDFLVKCEFSCVTVNNLTLPSKTLSLTGRERMCISAARLRRYDVFNRRKALVLPQDTLTLRCRMWRREDDVDKFGQCFGHTRLEIERILSVADMNPRITRKKTIFIHSDKQNKLLLSVKIFHEGDGLKININPINTEKIKFSTLKFSAVRPNTAPLNYLESWLKIPAEVEWSVPFQNIENKVSFSNELKLTRDVLVRNKLKLSCKFIYSTGEETKSVENVRPCSFKFREFPSNSMLSCIPSGKLCDYPSIYKDLWDMYSKQILCDVELKTQTTSFWVHKAVLCARSPVFLSMFTKDMKEKTANCVEIEDLGNDTLEKFLAFLYTDDFEEPEWNAVVGLYYAADKYQVERLKFFCRSFFANNIDLSNVCDLLMLADRHSDSDLKARIKYYILKRRDYIFGSSTWKKFSDKQPLLASSIISRKYSKKRLDDISGQRYSALSSYPNALEDFRSLYQTQTLSDIVIQTTSATFPAHKTIICAGSSTLRELLARENPPASLEMHDLEVDTVSRLLLFLYTDSLGDIGWTTASNLYHAAFIYQIERLKIKCSCYFLEDLIDSNAAHLMKLADEHQDVRLKSLVEDFVSMGYSKQGVFNIWKNNDIWENDDMHTGPKIYPMSFLSR